MGLWLCPKMSELKLELESLSHAASCEEMRPDDLDDHERLPKERPEVLVRDNRPKPRDGCEAKQFRTACGEEKEAWPQLFPPARRSDVAFGRGLFEANATAQHRQDAEKAAAVAMQAGDLTGAINVYTEVGHLL